MSWKTRPTIKIKYKGEELTVSQAAEKTGLDEYIIRGRIKNGWSPERIIETPARRSRKYQQRADGIKAKREQCDMMRTHDYRACFSCKHQDCICWGCVPQQKCEPNIKDYIREHDRDRKNPEQEMAMSTKDIDAKIEKLKEQKKARAELSWKIKKELGL